MRCRFRGTCCPTATPATANLSRRKIYEIVIAVILPCIFILVLACAIYLLRGAKKRPKLCGLQKFDISSKSIGEKNGDLEYDKPRVYQVSEDCDEVPC